MKRDITLKINGQSYDVRVEEDALLMDVIRKNLYMPGTKKGCGEGECGACTVLVDGVSQLSCLMYAVMAEGKEITTIEGLSKGGKLDPIQEAFVEAQAVQCGYCIPGMIMSTKNLLDKNPHPTEEEILDGMSGNICRCTGYKKIVDAVKLAAEKRA